MKKVCNFLGAEIYVFDNVKEGVIIALKTKILKDAPPKHYDIGLAFQITNFIEKTAKEYNLHFEIYTVKDRKSIDYLFQSNKATILSNISLSEWKIKKHDVETDIMAQAIKVKDGVHT